MMGHVTEIRLARSDEWEMVRDLARSAYAPYVERIGTEPWPMLEDYAALIEAGEVWVVDDDGIAGYVVLKEQSDHLLLDNVAVTPGRQGTGLGSRLLTFAEEHARARGQDEIRLYTNELMVENQAWYERVGYTETGRAREHGFARVFYEKRLPR